MFRNKKIIISVALVLTFAAGGGAWWYMNQSSNKNAAQKPAPSPAPYSSNTQQLSPSQGGNSISLTNPTPKPRPENSLLSPSQNNTSDQLGLNPQAINNNRSDTSSAEAMLNPKTFSKYDKHKNDQAASFAELLKGEGDELVQGKKAAVYYKGWLSDGTLFDMSRPDEEGKLQPFVFTLGANQVIPGWEQALAGMKPGGVRFLIIPPAVGYGAQAQDPIPPNSVLIFQVQLLAVE